MLDAALELAAAGWAVFPCRNKAPLARHGHLDATTDPEQIRKWWAKWPRAMIGAPVPASLLVIDADPRKDPDCLSKLGDAIRQPLPVTLAARSGRGDGGKHLYYLRPPGPLTGIRLPNGVDLKVNGYCIVPPSLHPDTSKPYRWEITRSLKCHRV